MLKIQQNRYIKTHYKQHIKLKLIRLTILYSIYKLTQPT